jgi:uncharacterized membrane protein YgcG
MLNSTKKMGLLVAVVLLGAFLNSRSPAEGVVRSVQDDAKLFDEKSLGEANAIIAKIKDKHGKDLVIETKEKGAADLKTAEKQAAAHADMLATKSALDGVYIIITKNPKQLQVQLIKKGQALLTIADRDELAKILRSNLAKDPNDALLKVANRTLEMVADRLKSAKTDSQPARLRTVKDEANVFSKDTIEEVNATVAKIKKQFGKDLLVESVAEGPEKEKAPKWASERYEKEGIDGVYIVIAKKPGYFRIVVGEKTLLKLFKKNDVNELEKILSSKQSRDKKIVQAVVYVLDTMTKASEPEIKEGFSRPDAGIDGPAAFGT